MIAVSLELLLLMYLTRRFRLNWLLVLLGLSVQLAVISLYRFELVNYWNREVYWSDSQMYWDASEQMLRTGKIPNVFNVGYVLYVYLIRISAFGFDAFFVNVSNVLLMVLSILLFSDLLGDRKKYYTYVTLFNPFIGYSLGRNLKDSLFLFLVALYSHSFVKSKNFFSRAVLSLIFSALIITVRPWGPLIMISSMILGVFESKKKGRVLFFLGSIVVVGAIMVVFKSQLDVWIPVLMDRISRFGALTLILAPFRLLLGPGPIRPMFPEDYFMFYTNVGRFFLSIGSLIWWIYVPFLIGWVLKNGLKVIHPVTVALMLFVLIYTIAYAGTGEIRFRGILYVLMPATVLLKGKFKRDIVYLYAMLLPIVVFPAVVMGLG